MKTKEQEFVEQLAVKKELYEEKLQKQIENLEEILLADLEGQREDIVKDYYLAKLNYDLKINLLELPAEEREKYLQELRELETQYMLSIQEIEAALLEEMENRIMDLEEEYNRELDEYKRWLENNIKKNWKRRRERISRYSGITWRSNRRGWKRR